MTNKELSNGFSVLLNSNSLNGQFGEGSAKVDFVLDEYEKSVFLTLAQDQMLTTFYDRRLNPTQEGMDDSAKRQWDFSNLIEVIELNPLEEGQVTPFDERAVTFNLPQGSNGQANVMFILNEQLKVDDQIYTIVPISYDQYSREMSKPYSEPLKKQAWRLFQNIWSEFDVVSEVIPPYEACLKIKEDGVVPVYRVRYVRRPRPIILENMPKYLAIEGEWEETTCELHQSLHRELLQLAVQLAVAAKAPKLQPNNNPVRRKEEDED